MPIDIATGMALTKTALDLVKSVREAIKQNKKLSEEEMKDYLETLQDKLVDVKTALADADDERRALKQRIEELERWAAFGNNFTAEHGVYWYDTFPYCPTCWDVDRKPVRLGGPLPETLHRGQIAWRCPFHKADMFIPYSARDRILEELKQAEG